MRGIILCEQKPLIQLNLSLLWTHISSSWCITRRNRSALKITARGFLPQANLSWIRICTKNAPDVSTEISTALRSLSGSSHLFWPRFQSFFGRNKDWKLSVEQTLTDVIAIQGRSLICPPVQKGCANLCSVALTLTFVSKDVLLCGT